MFLLSCSVPGASQVPPSKKPRSRGLFHSLFCCLCNKESDPPPLKNNAPLLVEENGTLSKVSSCRNTPFSLFLVISTFSFRPLSWSARLTATWFLEHMFSQRKAFHVCDSIFPRLVSNVQPVLKSTACPDIHQDEVDVTWRGRKWLHRWTGRSLPCSNPRTVTVDAAWATREMLLDFQTKTWM